MRGYKIRLASITHTSGHTSRGDGHRRGQHGTPRVLARLTPARDIWVTEHQNRALCPRDQCASTTPFHFIFTSFLSRRGGRRKANWGRTTMLEQWPVDGGRAVLGLKDEQRSQGLGHRIPQTGRDGMTAAGDIAKSHVAASVPEFSPSLGPMSPSFNSKRTQCQGIRPSSGLREHFSTLLLFLESVPVPISQPVPTL